MDRVSPPSERSSSHRLEFTGKTKNKKQGLERPNPTANPVANGTAPKLASYLADGREFAIVTIKPPKGYENTENKEMSRGSAWLGYPRAAAQGRDLRQTQQQQNRPSN